jgi:hypothetical protein
MHRVDTTPIAFVAVTGVLCLTAGLARAAEPTVLAAPSLSAPAAASANLKAPAEPNPTDPDPGHPYQAIIARNAFGLKEPPPPVIPPPKDPEPPVNTSALKLTGITTLLGKRAMFVLNDGRTNVVSDLVREGERDRFITNLEVLEIDADARTVKVVFGGREMRLDFVNNGLQPPTNMVAPPIMPIVASANTRPGMPTPTILPPPGSPSNPTLRAGNTAFNPAGANTVRTVPLRPSRLGMTPSGDVLGQTPQPQVSVEQQVLILQEQHRLAREMNVELPPAPPAPGLEHLSGGNLPVPPNLPGGGGPPAFPGQP